MEFVNGMVWASCHIELSGLLVLQFRNKNSELCMHTQSPTRIVTPPYPGPDMHTALSHARRVASGAHTC
jgi:hypothetical protein